MAGNKSALLVFSPQFNRFLNLSLKRLSEADRMIEWKDVLMVTTSAAVTDLSKQPRGWQVREKKNKKQQQSALQADKKSWNLKLWFIYMNGKHLRRWQLFHTDT